MSIAVSGQSPFFVSLLCTEGLCTMTAYLLDRTYSILKGLLSLGLCRQEM